MVNEMCGHSVWRCVGAAGGAGALGWASGVLVGLKVLILHLLWCGVGVSGKMLVDRVVSVRKGLIVSTFVSNHMQNRINRTITLQSTNLMSQILNQNLVSQFIWQCAPGALR